MSRAKKSSRLLEKLNHSLERDTPESAAPVAAAAAPAAVEVPVPPAALETIPPPAADPAKNEVLALPAVIPRSAPPARALSPADRRAQAEEIVRGQVLFAVGASLIPLPGVDLAAIGALQLKVLKMLARHYGVAFTRAEADAIVTALLGTVGGTMVASGALGSLAKFLPGLGTLISLTTLPIASSAMTLAMGRLAIDHFEAGGTMQDFDLDVAQDAFARKLAEAKLALA